MTRVYFNGTHTPRPADITFLPAELEAIVAQWAKATNFNSEKVIASEAEYDPIRDVYKTHFWFDTQR